VVPGLSVEFRVLGPLEVLRGGAVLDVGTPKQRAVLVLLLLHAGRPVPVPRLVDELWPGRAPASAVANVTTYISRLRRVRDCAVERDGGAYVLRAPAAAIDLCRFTGHADRGDAAWRGGDVAAAAAHWRQAVACWRGSPFEGVPTGPELDAARAEWTERRFAVFDRYVHAELLLGRGGDLVARLRRHTLAEPLRETGWLLLMAALRAGGNSAAALEAYEQGRTVLAERLGTDPGARLRVLHEAILREDDAAVRAVLDELNEPATDAPVRPHVAQLPATASRLLGRDRELARLDEMVLDRPSLTVVTGTAGIGKTALAVGWAARRTGAFPDGQLFVDLRGFAPGPPVTPGEALTGFLTALGLRPEAIPAEVDQQAARYRSLLAARRVLVVLDNAADPAQVRPLLLASAGSAVLVTSRSSLSELTALYDARHIGLAPLAGADSVDLLSSARPHGWSAAERPVAAELAELCGHLPLALRIAAANAGTTGAAGLADQAARLRAGRLDALALPGSDDPAVRGAFDCSYTALPAPVGRAFRLLGAAPGPDLSLAAAAALVDLPTEQTRRLLDHLAAAHLLDGAEDGYRMHDLVRLYAAERCAATETDGQRAAAVGRLLDFYLHTVRAATDLACPSGLDPLPPTGVRPLAFDSEQAAMAWLERARPALVAAVRHAAASSDVDTAAWSWTCARHLQRYFWFRRHGVDWLTMGEAARAAADRVGDAQAQARMMNFLGVAHWSLGAYEAAAAHLREALAVNERVGALDGQAANLSNLCGINRAMGRTGPAVGYGERSVALYEQLGDPLSLSNAQLNLAQILVDVGDLDRAGDLFARLGASYRAAGYTDGEASTLMGIGLIAEHRGCRDEAAATARTVLAMLPEDQALTNRIYARAALLALAPEPDASTVAALRDLAAEVSDLDDAQIEADIRCQAGAVALSLGRDEEAAAQFQVALTVARTGGEVPLAIDAQAGLAAARCALDPDPRRLVEVAAAVTEAAAHGLTIRWSTALTVAAEIALRLGERARAEQAARAALDVHTACGAVPWRRRALAVLDAVAALPAR
jgi:DNA-binding SARP family transcriptional activator/tetratricopeptide (TPR) repeat protein